MGKQFSISVVGSGSWATAIVKILGNNCDKVTWWIRNQKTVQYIKKYGNNPNYLSDIRFDPKKINPVSEIELAINSSDIIILAVPSAFLTSVLNKLTPKHFKGKIIFSAIKGIVPEKNLIVGDFLNKIYKIPVESIGVITGPCHAEEVALEKLSYLTIACTNTATAEKLAEMMRCRYMKVMVSDDIYGTEYAAVIKNILAICSGIGHGLGYGDNFQAVLISNGIAEIKRFVDRVHPITREITDSAYLGDLLVTAYSQFSRNRTFGNMVGKGYGVKAAQLEMNMIAEGYYASKCVKQINRKHKVQMPICDTVYRILYEKAVPKAEMKKLSEKLN